MNLLIALTNGVTITSSMVCKATWREFQNLRESLPAGGSSLAEFDSLYRRFSWGESADDES